MRGGIADEAIQPAARRSQRQVKEVVKESRAEILDVFLLERLSLAG
jgi:hypothetical protein